MYPGHPKRVLGFANEFVIQRYDDFVMISKNPHRFMMDGTFARNCRESEGRIQHDVFTGVKIDLTSWAEVS